MREQLLAVVGGAGFAVVGAYYVCTHAWRRAEHHCAAIDAQVAALRALRGVRAGEPPPEVREPTFETRLRMVASRNWNEGVWGIYDALRRMV